MKHFFSIQGRDPAGLPHPNGSGVDLYHASHGGQVLAMAPGLDHLKILKFKVAAYNKRTKSMDYFDDQRKEEFEFISGTKMREFARKGQQPPVGFMEPEAWKVLVNYYQTLQNHENGAAHV